MKLLWQVFTYLSGHPYCRATFANRDHAIAFQAGLHRQGYYYVPILRSEYGHVSAVEG